MVGISTIIPAYNCAATVGAAIDSALAQDIEGQEVIVVDDGSTDNTAEVLAAYGPRIQIVTQRNRGPAAARNAGASIALGEYFAFLDADDQWIAGKLEQSVSALKRNAHAVLAFSDYFSVDREGRAKLVSYNAPPPSLDDLLQGTWGILPSTVVMRRTTFQKCGGFCEEFGEPGGDDPYLWLLARECGEFAHIPYPLVRYRLSAPGVLARKYEHGAKVFEKLVRARYGERAAPLLHGIPRYFAGLFIAEACDNLRRGKMTEAARDLVRAFRISPGHFADRRLIARIFKPSSWRRLLGRAG